MYSELLWVFIPTIATISLSPGMCMALTCTLGLSQGYRRTLWMMWGELAGVATVVSTCVLLLAKIQSLAELLFAALAMVNPKGWAFMIALLPGFMSVEYSTPQQLAAFLGVMLPSEFLSMTHYATGARDVRRLLTSERHLANLHKAAAGLMVLVTALMLFRI